MKLALVPCTIRQARAVVKQLHRHLPKVTGGRFAVAARVGNQVVGVGIVGNTPPEWEGTTRMVITRVATDGTFNACTFIMGALCRAGRALGYTEAWTYTLPQESGASLRAAGFTDQGETDSGAGGSRATAGGRQPRSKVVPTKKRRWRRIL